MNINILGSGGVLPIPRPCCPCTLCSQARSEKEETWQTGPSMYVYGQSILFDTPEEIRFQLLRNNIDSVQHIIYTHWHPDHTQGMRIIEQITKRRPDTMPINVYIAKEQFELLSRFGCGNMLKYYESQNIVQLHWFEADIPIHFGHLSITPYFIEKTRGYFFKLTDTQSKKKAVYAPCEYNGLHVPHMLNDIDVLIAHCLWFEDNRIGHGTDFADTEDSFETMLSHAHEMNAKKIYIMHIEESFDSTVDELNQAARLCYPQYDIQFTKDNTIIDL